MRFLSLCAMLAFVGIASAQIINPPSALPNGATATTQSPGDNSTKIATTAYAQNPGAITPSSVTTNGIISGTTAYVTTLNLVSGTYTSGITTTGTTSQTCNLAITGGATATVALTGSNAIAGGTALVVTAVGSGLTTVPTTATVTSGTATCSGTATITTVVGVTATYASEYITCPTTCTITPEAPAAGQQLYVRNAPGSATVITLAALGASNYYELTTHAGWGTANHAVTSGGVATDAIGLVGYDANHLAVYTYVGTWTD